MGGCDFHFKYNCIIVININTSIFAWSLNNLFAPLCNFLRCNLEDLYEQCSFHSQKIPNSVILGVLLTNHKFFYIHLFLIHVRLLSFHISTIINFQLNFQTKIHLHQIVMDQSFFRDEASFLKYSYLY